MKKEYNKNIQGIALGGMDGLITTLAATIGMSAAVANPIIILITGFTVGIANATATSAGYFVSKEVETQHKLTNQPKYIINFSVITCFISSLILSLVVTLPYIVFTISTGRIISSTIAMTLLFLFGVWHAHYSKENLVLEGLKIMFIGLIAAAVCFLFGTYIPRLL